MRELEKYRVGRNILKVLPPRVIRAAKALERDPSQKFIHSDSRVYRKFLTAEKLPSTWANCDFDKAANAVEAFLKIDEVDDDESLKTLFRKASQPLASLGPRYGGIVALRNVFEFALEVPFPGKSFVPLLQSKTNNEALGLLAGLGIVDLASFHRVLQPHTNCLWDAADISYWVCFVLKKEVIPAHKGTTFAPFL